MSMSSLPIECLNNILYFLDNQLYNCLLVNRYWCGLIIPMLWSEPFAYSSDCKCSYKVIDSLLACLDEDEISSLIPCAIKFNNYTPLFEYGKYVKNIGHDIVVDNIVAWLNERESAVINIFAGDVDVRVEKLLYVIYHVIMRQGSNIRELDLTIEDVCVDIPKFTNYNHGITYLRCLNVGGLFVEFQNTIDFLTMVPRFCNSINKFTIKLSDIIIDPTLNIIKSQPLQNITLHIGAFNTVTDAKKVFYALEYRSKTLKKLSLEWLDFQDFDLSFMSKLECLERLKFVYCKGFVTQHYKDLFKKFKLKELELCCDNKKLKLMETMFNSLCGETLLRLTLNIITPETAKVIKKSCPNLNFLHFKILTDVCLNITIPLICELSSLKVLFIQADVCQGQLVKMLGDYLKFVKYLSLEFYVDLSSFAYFTSNCKANLNNLSIKISEFMIKSLICIEGYLICADNYQKVHNSLKELGFNKWRSDEFLWTNKSLEIFNSLKNQGVNIVSSI